MKSPANKAATEPRWQLFVTILSAVLASAYILAAYSSFTRPIWIDELLHFALGSHQSTADVWDTIRTTLPTFNFGQTGVYMIVDYWLLQLFGASSFWLRLPSLFAGALMLFSVVLIALRLRFNWAWTMVLLACFFCQQNMMYYVGEARPYLPLAGAVMGALAFYVVPRGQRGTAMRLLGAGAIWFGVLFHPYFPVYWLLMAIFGFVMHPVGATWRDKAAGFLRHCDPLLAIPAALACLMLAKLTWLSGASRLDLDPFQWIRAEGLFRTFIVLTHFQFLGKGNLVPLLALGLGLLGLLDPSVRNSQSFRRIGQPLVLLALALSMSAVLSVISYRRGYWILPRQWVASDALCCLAVVWCAKEFADWLKPLGRYADLAVVALLAWTPVLEAPDIYREKAGDVSTLAKAVFHPPKRAAPVAAPPIDKLPADNDAWVTLANENIAAGGPVWPVFRRFYQKN